MEKERIYCENISRVIQNKKRDAVGIVDNRLNTNYLNAVPVQRVSEEDEDIIQGKLSAPIQRNETGMPDNLKVGIENLSGFSMDDVRVHYNSSKPATVQALAYTQGTDIHIAPGQEKHLPHEAWHVAQQMAGRVSPTTNINGMPVNDNAELEHEADVMGEKAVQCKYVDSFAFTNKKYDSNIIQCVPHITAYPPMAPMSGTQHRQQNPTCPYIVFETMASVDRTNELVGLYHDVISKYEGKACVVMGVNRDSTTETDLDRVVNELRKTIQRELFEGHTILIIKFEFNKIGEGSYSFPFQEARRLLMQHAPEDADYYRWIDSDVRNDTSIDAINRQGSEEFNPVEGSVVGPVVYSGFYNWRRADDSEERGTDVSLDRINKHEAFFRRFFWYNQGCYNGGKHKYQGTGYIPEPIAYMNREGHQDAMDNLGKNLKSLGDKCQQNEARAAFQGLSMIFKPNFSVTKPAKKDYNVSAPDESLEQLSRVRQSAFDQWMLSTEKSEDSEKKRRVLESSKRLNSLLSMYKVIIKKEKEDELLSAIFNDIIYNKQDCLDGIENFLKWKAEGNYKHIGNSRYVTTSPGGRLLAYKIFPYNDLIANKQPHYFFVV